MNDITSQFSMRDNRSINTQSKHLRNFKDSNVIQSQQFSNNFQNSADVPIQADYIDRNVLDAPLAQLHNLDISSNSNIDINLNKSFEIYNQFEQEVPIQEPIKSNPQLITREPIKPQQSIPKLRNMKSRLDMLDNSQLTSFPLAPPRVCSEAITNGNNLKSPEINAQDIIQSRPNSQFLDIDPIVLVEDYIKQKQLNRKKLSVMDLKTSIKTFNSMDQNESPQGPNYLTRAKSILSETFPSSLQNSQHDNQDHQLPSSQPSTLLLTKNSIDDEEESITSSNQDFYSAKTSQSRSLSSTGSIHTNVSHISNISNVPTLKLSTSNDQTFGEFSIPSTSVFASSTTSLISTDSNNINGDSSLRYCVICDSPLYEISSLLTQDNQFSEFVCSNCTEQYEQLSKLIESFDQSISGMKSIPEDSSIDDIEELLNQPVLKKTKIESLSSSKYNGFSSHLVNKLHTQLESSNLSPRSPQRFNRPLMHHHQQQRHQHTQQHQQQTNLNSRQSQWLNEARRKLRWRWRLSGLLPQFLEKK
ncbi:hypothetical protein BN7_1883 [Wickerhamomyces ciferrii]|uniref:Uncharacterized protein n=1 Tax=Wickerhamomyces ciferrii (strain ATCC 14091 / BCRC 22168 / CBS 111 / JCM 3599 / NBRC 0793 / NRRL Y-1031 F-60-10) TaxID=1206466 RepID=K0KLX0_WICCF|nr:uncharacterized protein BN7_1883 [Wickerhamomyces ciferrii]CCH42339.1 hypothetical protein BN7_1883 [Wickerhamomyces ciferrii]